MRARCCWLFAWMWVGVTALSTQSEAETLSAADFYLVMLARWARPMTNPPRSRPHITKLLDIVTALPAVRRAYEREGVTDEIC